MVFCSVQQDDSKVQPPPGSPQIVIESKDENTESRIQPASLYIIISYVQGANIIEYITYPTLLLFAY